MRKCSFHLGAYKRLTGWIDKNKVNKLCQQQGGGGAWCEFNYMLISAWNERQDRINQNQSSRSSNLSVDLDGIATALVAIGTAYAIGKGVSSAFKNKTSSSSNNYHSSYDKSNNKTYPKVKKPCYQKEKWKSGYHKIGYRITCTSNGRERVYLEIPQGKYRGKWASFTFAGYGSQKYKSVEEAASAYCGCN